MATKGMEDLTLTEKFPCSYPHLAWTPEEEEAFNLITPMEWPQPKLSVRFARAVKAVAKNVYAAIRDRPGYPGF